MFNFFKRPSSNEPEIQPLNFVDFCNYFNGDEEKNVLKFLNIPLGILTKATQSQIDSNPQDVRNGVSEVYYNNNIYLLGIFDSIVFKIFNDGSKQYFLNTITADAILVKQIADTFYEHFGEGNFNAEKFSSFKEFSNIENIASGNVFTEKDDCVNWWTGENDYLLNFQIYLQYTVNPLRQLILNINESAPI